MAARKARLLAALADARLDGALLFAPESDYWLTGYDTFGFCFFQCLYVGADGRTALLTRSADLRQAQRTSDIKDIRIWKDAADAEPTRDLARMLHDLGAGRRLGVEYNTQGLTHYHGRRLEAALAGRELVDVSALVPRLRVSKSPVELAYVREAARLSDLADRAALDATGAGADEGEILAAMHHAIFAAGGDYPGNEFIIGSGADALLCRYKSGRRKLDADDQLRSNSPASAATTTQRSCARTSSASPSRCIKATMPPPARRSTPAPPNSSQAARRATYSPRMPACSTRTGSRRIGSMPVDMPWARGSRRHGWTRRCFTSATRTCSGRTKSISCT